MDYFGYVSEFWNKPSDRHGGQICPAYSESRSLGTSTADPHPLACGNQSKLFTIPCLCAEPAVSLQMSCHPWRWHTTAGPTTSGQTTMRCYSVREQRCWPGVLGQVLPVNDGNLADKSLLWVKPQTAYCFSLPSSTNRGYISPQQGNNTSALGLAGWKVWWDHSFCYAHFSHNTRATPIKLF